jgi:hypothetical protein
MSRWRGREPPASHATPPSILHSNADLGTVAMHLLGHSVTAMVGQKSKELQAIFAKADKAGGDLAKVWSRLKEEPCTRLCASRMCSRACSLLHALFNSVTSHDGRALVSAAQSHH